MFCSTSTEYIFKIAATEVTHFLVLCSATADAFAAYWRRSPLSGTPSTHTPESLAAVLDSPSSPSSIVKGSLIIFEKALK